MLSQTTIHRGPQRIPIADRFWAHVDKNGPIPQHVPEIGPCWVWTGSKHKPGYGNMKLPGGLSTVACHRVSWEIHCGTIPDKLFVLHRCDNRSCVRPDHLWLGTHQDNNDDRDRKGRHSKGENQPRAKLTNDGVRHIRELAATGMSRKKIAKQLGVSPSRIDCIIWGRAWKHVS